MGRRSRRGLAVLLLAAALAACSRSAEPTATAVQPPSPSLSRAAEPTLWLCRPGTARNPCEGNLTTTVVAPNGARRTRPFRPAADPRIDCFYAYPTVSRATTTNAPLASAPEIVSTTRAQAALFASVCRLYVPVYRQITTRGLTSGGFINPTARSLALQSFTDAWHDYLAHDNHGRGVVLIGHSQGAIVLAQLIATEIDRDPA